jgi:Uncharacterized conserved protein
MSMMSHALSAQSIREPVRTIEVSGTAEQLLDPDEIVFVINIQEYWKEEFEGKKYKDYKTKISIATIETQLIAELNQQGIGMERITLKEAGNHWRARGKDFLISKKLELKIDDFKVVNMLSNRLQTRGIQSMNVSALKHKDEDKIKLETQVAAIKAAKEKAQLMASALDKEIIDVITIIEVNRHTRLPLSPHTKSYARESAISLDEGSQGVEYDSFKQLKISATVRVVFEMD